MAGGMGGMGMGFGGGPRGSMRSNMTPEERAAAPKLTWTLFKRVFGYLIPYKFQLIAIVIIIGITSALGILPAYLTGKIIDLGFNGHNFNILVELIAISLGVFVVSNLISVLQNYINIWVSQHVVFDMRNQMYDHLQRMPHKFFTGEKPGAIITRMTSDINGVNDVISNTIVQIISNVLVICTTTFALIYANAVLGIVGVILVPIFIFPTRRVGKTRFNLLMKTQAKTDEMNQKVNETLNVSGSLLVKLFSKETYELESFRQTNNDIIKLSIRETMAGRWFNMMFSTFINMGPMLIYFVGGILVLKMHNTSLTIGAITMMIALVNRLYGPVNSLFNIQVTVTRSMALFSRIFDYFDKPIEIEDAPDAVIPSTMAGKITFEHVDFSYIPEKPVLKDLTFTIEPGKTVAIVGTSGAGKSTIINLIPRLYDVTGGRVCIDDIDIRKLSLEFVRKNIGYVTQDTYLFNGTILENLLYANESATKEQIDDACKRANIYNFIMSLPEKYDTIVGNRGLKLSGGEKQRVSIARTILTNPKLLILDEATSSLDSVSETLIQEAIEPLLVGRTSIVIAHRLSTIINADEILVIDGGTVAERGRHEELLAQSNIYHTLYTTQFKQALRGQPGELTGNLSIS